MLPDDLKMALRPRKLSGAFEKRAPGRAFLRHLIDLAIGVRSPNFSICPTRSVKDAVNVWLPLLSQYNCKSLFLPDVWNNSVKLSILTLTYTDAAGSIGIGTIFGHTWCYGSWPDNGIGKNITILEFYPIVLSYCCLWGDQLCNQCVLFFTDNEALVHVINKQSCRDPSLMPFCANLFSFAYNIIFFLKQNIPGVHNTLADSLSRLQVASVTKMAPVSMCQSPTEIPPHLLPQNWQT